MEKIIFRGVSMSVLADIGAGISDQCSGFIQVLLYAITHESQFSLIRRMHVCLWVDVKNIKKQIFIITQAFAEFTTWCT